MHQCVNNNCKRNERCLSNESFSFHIFFSFVVVTLHCAKTFQKKKFFLSECYNVNSVTHSFNNYWSDLDHKAVKKSRSTMDKYKINFSLIPQFSWFNLILSCLPYCFRLFLFAQNFFLSIFNSIPFFQCSATYFPFGYFFIFQYNCNDNSMACSMAYNNNYLLWLAAAVTVVKKLIEWKCWS